MSCLPFPAEKQAEVKWQDQVRGLRQEFFRDIGDGFPGFAHAAFDLVSCHVASLPGEKNGISALSLQRSLGLGTCQTSWLCLHKLHKAMVRPGRERLSGTVEVDETYIGGTREGKRGRGADGKVLVLVAA